MHELHVHFVAMFLRSTSKKNLQSMESQTSILFERYAKVSAFK